MALIMRRYITKSPLLKCDIGIKIHIFSHTWFINSAWKAIANAITKRIRITTNFLNVRRMSEYKQTRKQRQTLSFYVCKTNAVIQLIRFILKTWFMHWMVLVRFNQNFTIIYPALLHTPHAKLLEWYRNNNWKLSGLRLYINSPF